MKPAAFNKRRDANEPAIIAALRAAGATVEQLSGPNVPDLLVGFRGANWLLEVKAEKGKQTAEQAMWMTKWRGNAGLVRTPEEALERIGITIREAR